MKKVLAIILALGVLSASGCVKKDAGNTEKVKITLGLPGGDGVTAMRVVNDFIEKNADKYDVIKDESSWGDFEQKVKLQFVSKNDVTTVFVTDSLTAPSMGADGALDDLAGRMHELDESKYTDTLRALTDTEGHLWGVPHDINPIAIAYNKDVFDAKGIAYPAEDWTWQDMLDIAKSLTTDSDNDGVAEVYGLYYGTNVTQGWWPFFSAVGTSPYKDDFRNCNLDDPKVQEALEKYQKPFMDGVVPVAAEVAAHGNAAQMFAEGMLGMFLIQAGQCGIVNNFAPDLNWDVQIMPYGWNGERTCIYVPNIWVMYKGASEAEKNAGWEFMKYYLSEEAQMIIAKEGPTGYPAMKTALDAVASNGQKPEGKDAFYREIDKYGKSILENPCSLPVEKVMQQMMNLVRDNEKPIPELIADAKSEIQDQLDYYYSNIE